MNAKREWGEQSPDSNVKRRVLLSGRTLVTSLLIFSFLLAPFSFSKAMQKTEDRVAMAAVDFPKLVDEYMTDLYARHPNAAAATGLHAWDGQLEDYSSGAISAEISAIKKFQSRLEKIPPLELGFSDLFYYQILASNMKSRLLELEQIKSHERNPGIYNDAISTGLLQIASFE